MGFGGRHGVCTDPAHDANGHGHGGCTGPVPLVCDLGALRHRGCFLAVIFGHHALAPSQPAAGALDRPVGLGQCLGLPLAVGLGLALCERQPRSGGDRALALGHRGGGGLALAPTRAHGLLVVRGVGQCVGVGLQHLARPRGRR